MLVHRRAQAQLVLTISWIVLAMSSCFLVISVLHGHLYLGTMTTSHYSGHLLPVTDVFLNIQMILGSVSPPLSPWVPIGPASLVAHLTQVPL